MRNYNITKYKGNTHYTVNVTDSFGQEYTSFFKTVKECGKYIIDIWENEVKKPVDLLSKAIIECIKLDEERGVEPNLD